MDVLVCETEPLGPGIGEEDWKNAEKAKPRELDWSREFDPAGTVGATGVA